MAHTDDIVIGIDGGGTHTRVMVSDFHGNVLSYIKTGSGSIDKDLQAKHNVNEAIWEALSSACKELRHVRGIAAGISGYDSEEDLEWVEALTDVAGLACPRWHVNDAVVAHYGALVAKPGIIAISGTGSIILAITEDGQFIRNYDFHHYAASAARFLAYDAVFEVLAGNSDESDSSLIRSMLVHWAVPSMEAFRLLARSGFSADQRERDKKFGEFAPVVTEAAWHGSSAAARVCMRAIQQLKVGIELLAGCFKQDTVSVSFIGSVANSAYFSNELRQLLSHGNHKRYSVVEPQLPPVAGAVLYALNRLGIAPGGDIVSNLRKG